MSGLPPHPENTERAREYDAQTSHEPLCAADLARFAATEKMFVTMMDCKADIDRMESRESTS